MDTERAAGDGREYVARARRLAPQIEAHADQIEQERRLAEPVLDALHAAGMFRLLLPRALDGADRKSTRLNSSHIQKSRMPSSA